MDKVIGVVDKLVAFSSKEDGTYDYITSESVEYSDGYQVSFVRPEAFEVLTKQQWDIITNYFCEFFESAVNIGVYQNAAEVSFHCIPKNKACEIMEKYNQESIMDWQQKTANPNNAEKWFIFNRNFDESKKVSYNEIIAEI